jgi:hypothetical protein
MPMPSYPVICYGDGCSNEAAYKVAALWSDGVTGELKTYYLACADCLKELFRLATIKKAQCRLAPGESLSEPGIYLLAHGERDRRLVRCEEEEQRLKA